MQVAEAAAIHNPTMPGPEWWERLAAWWQARRQRRPDSVRRWATVRTVVLWVSLVGLVAAFVIFPQFRTGLKIWLWLYLLLVAWFVLARTKTASWRLVAGIFAVGMPWSVAIALVSTQLSDEVGRVAMAGAGTAIAGFTEESLKLVPVAVLALLAPGLVRRFAVVDWLLVGFASGLAFQAFEELGRRTLLNVREPGPFQQLDILLAEMRGEDPYGPGSGYPQYGLSLLAGGSSTDIAAFAGHHVSTALVGVGIGLGVAAWRRRWLILAPVVPLVLWWLVVVDHFGYNAAARTSQLGWVEDEDAAAPWLIRATWDWTGHGFGRGWLLLGLFVVALLVDARTLCRGDARSGFGSSLSAAPKTLISAPGLVADRWMARIAPDGRPRPWRTAAGAACCLAVYVIRDVVVIVSAHARRPSESRRRAVAAGRMAVLALREQKVAALLAAAPYGRLGRWPVRVLAAVGLAVLLVAAVRVAPAIASQIGESLTHSWLAGLFEALGDWWDGLGIGGQLAVAAGLAGLIVISGGSLGLAFGLSGAATYLLDHGHGLADFTRDPASATRDYLATTTPQGMLLDFGEFALTFAPANFGGAVAGQYSRRLAVRMLGPRVNAARLTAGRSVFLVDGNVMRPLSQVEVDGMVRYADEIPWQNAPSPNRAADAYQQRVYGNREPIISQLGEPVVRGDGLNLQYGSVGDAKYRVSASSWYDPESLPPGIRNLARDNMEQMLLDYKHAIEEAAGPLRTLEITTNDPQVARVFSDMMRELDVPGYVVIQP